MAIYHFSAKMIGRAAGSSTLAAAAYRSASRLHDERLDRHHDFSNKAGVVHSEVMLPDNAPEEWRDREKLWNAVEAAEARKDAQLAREIEFAIPRELDRAEGDVLASLNVREGMASMAKSLERDPQLESLLRKRLPELGLKRVEGASLSHDLSQWTNHWRSRGLGR